MAESKHPAEYIAALALDSRRYKWLANRVLLSDYGDNDRGRGIGWWIRPSLRRGPLMFGSSIDEAIDNAMRAEEGERSAGNSDAATPQMDNKAIDDYLRRYVGDGDALDDWIKF